MAYDSDRGVCVLFGGFGATTFGGTWEYTGGSTPVKPTTWGRIKTLFGEGME